MPRLRPLDLDRLFRSERDRLLLFFTRRTADPEVGLDLLAETFAQAVASAGRFRTDATHDGVPWLFGIAKHQLALYHRRGACERRALERFGIELEPPSAEVLSEVLERAGIDDLRNVLTDALDTLTPATREAVRLRVVEELSYDEVSRRLEVSPGAARVRVSRGLAQLAAELDIDRRLGDVML